MRVRGSLNLINLLYETTRCAFLAQEKNSALGVIWHLLNPLAMTLVLYGVFSQVRQFDSVPDFGPYYCTRALRESDADASGDLFGAGLK